MTALLKHKKIIVIGATGMLGFPVAQKLKEDGFNVRIMVRDIKRAQKIFDNSYDLVEGDVKDFKSIKSALNNCYGVHINLSGEIEQIGVENVVKAGILKKIERISYISGTSVREDTTYNPIIKRKFLAEKSIIESGISYCIFCPTWFMESLPKFIKGNHAYLFGKQPNPYHFIAASDFAKMVSNSYKLENPVYKRFFIHGPEGILFEEALKRYCSVFHPEIKKISKMPFWLANIIATIKRSKEMKSINDFMRFFEKAGEKGDPTEANNILGAPKITLDEWLYKYKVEG